MAKSIKNMNDAEKELQSAYQSLKKEAQSMAAETLSEATAKKWMGVAIGLIIAFVGILLMSLGAIGIITTIVGVIVFLYQKSSGGTSAYTVEKAKRQLEDEIKRAPDKI